MSARSHFIPKHKECENQCPSCPFRDGNDKEFGAILDKLREKHGVKGKSKKIDIVFARDTVKEDVKKSGSFICHHTAYDAEMNLKPPGEHRQCKGATTKS